MLFIRLACARVGVAVLAGSATETDHTNHLFRCQCRAIPYHLSPGPRMTLIVASPLTLSLHGDRPSMDGKGGKWWKRRESERELAVPWRHAHHVPRG